MQQNHLNADAILRLPQCTFSRTSSKRITLRRCWTGTDVGRNFLLSRLRNPNGRRFWVQQKKQFLHLAGLRQRLFVQSPLLLLNSVLLFPSVYGPLVLFFSRTTEQRIFFGDFVFEIVVIIVLLQPLHKVTVVPSLTIILRDVLRSLNIAANSSIFVITNHCCFEKSFDLFVFPACLVFDRNVLVLAGGLL